MNHEPSTHRIRVSGLALLLAASLASSGCGPAPISDAAHYESIERWQAERDRKLRAPDGWLSLVGLHWLGPGENTFGSGADNAVQFPAGRVADRVGVFDLDGDRVTVRVIEGVGVTLRGQPVREQVLASDSLGEPDVLELDELLFYVIERGPRFGIRVKDPRSEVLARFTGMDYFPIDPTYRVEGRFLEYETPRETQIPTVVGVPETVFFPGRVEFELAGKSHTLQPVVYDLDDESYFYIFKDETTGHETYGAGRFLYGPRAENGAVVLDFNKAYNPPCVFTPYATCPLPPPGNELALRIEAGEKTWGSH